MRTSVAKTWIKLEVCLCTRPRGAWNKFCGLFPASCMCNGPPKLCYWACQSASMAMRGCGCAAVVFLTCAALTRQRAACASQSDSITFAGPVSPRTLNAACLRVKVESIKILTARPALNWPCAVLASRRYNAIRCHGRDLVLGACTQARTHGRACVHGQGTQGIGRGRNTRGAALGSASSECSSLWLAKYKQIACQSPNWSRLNKYSKISNSCVNFESNRIASNYSIRFEISNIRTSLMFWTIGYTTEAKVLAL